MMKIPSLDFTLQIIDDSVELAEETAFSTWCQYALQYGLADKQAVHSHPSWQITVRIVDAEEGKMLNRDYRHKDYATNVLSFYYDDPFADFEFSDVEEPLPAQDIGHGDIIICAPVVIEEARLQQKSIRAHTAHLTVHATLHLLGYDHETLEEADRMETLEIVILQQLNFNNPYEE